MLRYDTVSFAYATAPDGRKALDAVTLDLSPGEIVAVVGANGSGKSTLARLANGIELPSEGMVTVDGTPTNDAARVFDVRSSVGIVFQHPDDQIVATSVEDDVAFGPENLGLPRAEIRVRVDEAIAAVGLTGLERREPHLLSGGQKQRLAIAGALAMRPRYLVLDEPTSMLDPVGRDEVLTVIETLAGQGHGVLFITHDLAEAACAERVVVLSEGRTAFEGSLSQLLGDARLEMWALERPIGYILGGALRERGVAVPPGAMDADAIAGALWA